MCVEGKLLVNYLSGLIQVIAAVYLAAILSQLTRFFDVTIEPIEIPSLAVVNRTLTACYVDFVPLLAGYLDIYFNVYFWFRVVFIHFVPCTALVCFTGALCRAMQLARRRREQLLKLNRRQECLRLQVSQTKKHAFLLKRSAIVQVHHGLRSLSIYLCQRSCDTKVLVNMLYYLFSADTPGIVMIVD